MTLFQQVLMHVCLWALFAMGLAGLCVWISRTFGEMLGMFFDEFRRNKFVVLTVPLVVSLVYVGSTKNAGPNFIPGATSDAEIGLVGITTETNSVPDTVVSVYYTSGTVLSSTPVSVRNLQTDAWTELVKTDCQYDTLDTTNVFRFVTAGTNWLNATYWHVGTSKPPIIVSSSDIFITSIVSQSGFIRIAWRCTDPNCTSFSVMTSEDGNSWSVAGTTTSKEYTCVGFLVGKTRWWKVTSSYLKETE